MVTAPDPISEPSHELTEPEAPQKEPLNLPDPSNEDPFAAEMEAERQILAALRAQNDPEEYDEALIENLYASGEVQDNPQDEVQDPDEAVSLLAGAMEQALQQLDPLPELPDDGWLQEVTELARSSPINQLADPSQVDLLAALAMDDSPINPWRSRILPPGDGFLAKAEARAQQVTEEGRCREAMHRVAASSHQLWRQQKQVQIARRARQAQEAERDAFASAIEDTVSGVRIISSSHQIRRSEGKIVRLRAFDTALEIYRKWEARERELAEIRSWRDNQAVSIEDLGQRVDGPGFTISGGTPLQTVDTAALRLRLAQALAQARSPKAPTHPESPQLEGLAHEHSIDTLPDYEVPKDYFPAAESLHEIFRLKVSTFEGPLDLLLFLIRRHQLDILDIPIAFICAEYLQCLKAMQDLSLDVAAEFLFMASELVHLKSKCLLPRSDELEEEEEEDPRWTLVHRLLEYQKYRDAAISLEKRDRLGRDNFERPPERIEVIQKTSKLKEVGSFQLIQAFDSILKRQKTSNQHNVIMETISLRDRIHEMIHELATRRSLPFDDLITSDLTRIQLIVTFLACLEMAKLRLMKVFQSESGALYLEPRFSDPQAATRRLDGLEEDQYAG